MNDSEDHGREAVFVCLCVTDDLTDGGSVVGVESAPEGEELDLITMLTEGPLLIEWAERIGTILSPERLWVTLETISEEHRQMHFRGTGKRYDSLVSDLRQALFGVA